MSLLDDTAIFAAIVAEGGLNRAAKKLGFSNGLISRRLTQLEKRLGVTLLKRTTRRLQLTPEGELYWEHAKRIQKELDCAVCMIQSLADKPTGNIRISAPPYFGRHYLASILSQFMSNVPGITIDLLLSDELHDPIEKNIDLLIRGIGYSSSQLKDSSLKTKLLLEMKIKLYASPVYFSKREPPKNPHELTQHAIIGYKGNHYADMMENWVYKFKKKISSIDLTPTFSSNDMDTRVKMCLEGHGIAKLTELIYSNVASETHILQPILTDYDWGSFQVYAVYAQQQSLPKRTRLLLDFIISQMQQLQKNLRT